MEILNLAMICYHGHQSSGQYVMSDWLFSKIHVLYFGWSVELLFKRCDKVGIITLLNAYIIAGDEEG